MAEQKMRSCKVYYQEWPFILIKGQRYRGPLEGKPAQVDVDTAVIPPVVQGNVWEACDDPRLTRVKAPKTSPQKKAVKAEAVSEKTWFFTDVQHPGVVYRSEDSLAQVGFKKMLGLHPDDSRIRYAPAPHDGVKIEDAFPAWERIGRGEISPLVEYLPAHYDIEEVKLQIAEREAIENE